MKKLWIIDAPKKFNPQKDILLGPWCLEDKGYEYYEKNSFDFSINSLDPYEQMSIDAKNTRNFADSYVVLLSKKFNLLLGTDYSSNFWRIIIMPWLLTLTENTWEKQKIIDDFIQKNKNKNIEVDLIENSEAWNFKNTQEFVNYCLKSKQFNLWLYSRLIESKIPPIFVINLDLCFIIPIL